MKNLQILCVGLLFTASSMQLFGADDSQLEESIRASLNGKAVDGHQDKFDVYGAPFKPGAGLLEYTVNFAGKTIAITGDALVHGGCNLAKAAKPIINAAQKRAVDALQAAKNAEQNYKRNPKSEEAQALLDAQDARSDSNAYFNVQPGTVHGGEEIVIGDDEKQN